MVYQKTIYKVFLLAVSIFHFFGSAESYAYEVNKNAIPLLAVKDSDENLLTTGSGFIVQPEGILITAYHLLIGSHRIDAVFSDGTSVPVKGVRYVDRAKDFAVLQLEEGFYSTLELGNSEKLKAFDYSSALGFLYDESGGQNRRERNKIRQTYGLVLGIHPQADPGFSLIYMTTGLSHGISGGPIVDLNNKVIGIALVEDQALNLGLPIHYITPYLDKGSLRGIEEFLKEDEQTKENLYFKGEAALNGEGNSEAAIAYFERCLKMDPNFGLAHYELAKAYRNQGQPEKELVAYEKALQINPAFPEALSNLGAQYYQAGKIDKAVDTFKKAINVFPNFIQALSNLGAVLNKLKRFEEALPYLKKTVFINPQFAMAYFNLGNAHFGRNEFQKAREAFETAADLGVSFVSLHWKLFEIHQRSGQQAKAIQELKYILELHPEDPKAQSLLNKMKSGRSAPSR